MKKSSFVYCTYFDKKYLVQGFTLIDSILEHMPNSKIYVLCLDEDTEYQINLLYSENVVPISLDFFEHIYEGLVLAKLSRNKIEYIFTLTPFFVDFVFVSEKGKSDFVIYLDSDTFFFNSIEESITSACTKYNASILLSPHNHSPKLKAKFAKYGIYNVGILAFKTNADSKDCINWWKDRCLEFCPDEPKNGSFADQKYLDDFHLINSHVAEFNDAGINLAPWNLANVVDLELTNNNQVIVDQVILKLFHFHSIKKVNNCFFPLINVYKAHLSPEIVKFIYIPYLRKIMEISNKLNFDTKNLFRVKLGRGKGYKKIYIFIRTYFNILLNTVLHNYISEKELNK